MTVVNFVAMSVYANITAAVAASKYKRIIQRAPKMISNPLEVKMNLNMLERNSRFTRRSWMAKGSSYPQKMRRSGGETSQGPWRPNTR